MPSMLFFEFPENKVVVEDLVFQALDPSILLAHFIADFGGDVDVTYKNLKLIGAVNDFWGGNVRFGIHSMRGPACVDPCDREGDASLHGVGNAVFEAIDANNVRAYTVAPMWYRDGTLRIADVTSDAAVAPWGMINMETDITNVYSEGSWRAIWLGYVEGGNTTVNAVLADGGTCPAIVIRDSEIVDIRDSWISGCNGFGVWWRNPILIAPGNRNITIADNVFTDIRNVPSAVLVLPDLNNTEILIRDNFYDPSYFTGPPGAWAVQLGSDDSLVIEPSLTPEQVRDLGVNNTLILGE